MRCDNLKRKFRKRTSGRSCRDWQKRQQNRGAISRYFNAQKADPSLDPFAAKDRTPATSQRAIEKNGLGHRDRCGTLLAQGFPGWQLRAKITRTLTRFHGYEVSRESTSRFDSHWDAPDPPRIYQWDVFTWEILMSCIRFTFLISFQISRN